ncbi:TetR/AcrR family transcriptional regulator [Lactobacillus sp. XV13L]|nr:TetR/AcrR family transcriptional regulator [Lactobacillus sp. XV13L]
MIMPRTPTQKRSRAKQKKILQTAKELFIQKNYFEVSTNEIAKSAGLSIGTLYSYFTDKKEILLYLLKEYDESFGEVFKELNSPESFLLFKNNVKKWLFQLIDMLTEQEDVQFHLQIETLQYAVPEVKSALEKQKKKMQKLTKECLLYYISDDINVSRIANLAVVLFDFTSSLVDEILYGNNDMQDNKDIKELGVEYLSQIVAKFITREKQ